MIQASLEQAFGEGILGSALFYRFDRSLRFELAQGDSVIERFRSAVDRSSEIARVVFGGADDVEVALVFDPRSVWLIRRQLSELEIPVPKSRQLEWCIGRADEPERCLTFGIGLSAVERLLFGVCASELGVRPRLWASMYAWSLDRGVLLHPYDDRGMDVVASDLSVCSELLTTHVGWLLQYDLGLVKQRFPEHRWS